MHQVETDLQDRIDSAVNALSVSRLRDLHVGLNDILVVHVRIVDVPPSSISNFLSKVKANLKPAWQRVGLDERVLYEASETSGFSVIHVRKDGPKPMLQKRHERPEPPIIG
jgi:hypothetical protein